MCTCVLVTLWHDSADKVPILSTCNWTKPGRLAPSPSGGKKKIALLLINCEFTVTLSFSPSLQLAGMPVLGLTPVNWVQSDNKISPWQPSGFNCCAVGTTKIELQTRCLGDLDAGMKAWKIVLCVQGEVSEGLCVWFFLFFSYSLHSSWSKETSGTCGKEVTFGPTQFKCLHVSVSFPLFFFLSFFFPSEPLEVMFSNVNMSAAIYSSVYPAKKGSAI